MLLSGITLGCSGRSWGSLGSALRLRRPQLGAELASRLLQQLSC